MSEHVPSIAPGIDTEAIATYCDLVFGYLEGHVSIRAIAEKGTPPKPPHVETRPVGSLTERLSRLSAGAAQECRGLYVVPCTTARPEQAKLDNIVQTGVIVVDLDTGQPPDALAHLRHYLGTPSLVVASGGSTPDGQDKLHVYWRLDEPAINHDLERVRQARDSLASKVGGDPSFKRLTQPIRVPGSIHRKGGGKSPVRILEANHLEYALDDLLEGIAAMPILALPDAQARPQHGDAVWPSKPFLRDLSNTVIRAGGLDSTTRFEAISSMAGNLLRQARLGHLDLPEAWSQLQQFNRQNIDPPWDALRLRREFEALHRLDARNHPAADADPVSAPAGSEDALAAAFVAAHGSDHLFVPEWGQWLEWTGTHWRRDHLACHEERARLVCRKAASGADNANASRRIASQKTIAAVLRIARADPAVATLSDEWDADPMLLNTPAGVIHLATGEIEPHASDQRHTKICTAAPGGDCPRWRQFLDEITDGNTELAAYLQRLAGYSLTGRTDEQVFVFFNGPGANGKTVFLQTLSHILGDYAATAALETFMASQTQRHLSELAGLRGARFVTVSETETGRTWAEAKLKAVTGGEKIRVNFMRQDLFEFRPQFKLLISGNQRPGFTGSGEAMRRRLHVVPLEVVIPEDRRDKRLPETLIGEAGGILSWMLDGCLDWQRRGLAPPAAVRDAAQGYLEDEDLVGQWIEENCVTGPDLRAVTQTLYRNWSQWSYDRGVPTGSQKALGQALRDYGFRDTRIHGARGRLGIDLKRVTTGTGDEK